MDIPESAYTLARAFWPGPLTMVLKKGDAVLLVVDGIGGTGIAYTIDNFKIVVDPDSPLNGNGSLEIPDWGSDNDGLEF